MMPAKKPRKRSRTARYLAEKIGATPRTVRRHWAQRRGYYLREARRRRNMARSLRREGLTWREIGDAMGGISREAARSLARRG